MKNFRSEKVKHASNVSIVGMGNWGTSLASAFAASRIRVDEIIVRSEGRRLPAPFTVLKEAHLNAEIMWLCVQDRVIPAVTQNLVRHAERSRISLKGKVFVHSSGALDAAVMQSAVHAGASVASVHPLMTFPDRTPVSLKDVPFGIEADPRNRRVLTSIVRRIGGRPVMVKSGSKALYHIVGMLCSPLLLSHLEAARQSALLAGLSQSEAQTMIEPIVHATLKNLFKQGASKSFSGPLARGDEETIRLHLRALEPHPMLAAVYRSLANYALISLPSNKRKEMKRLLG